MERTNVMDDKWLTNVVQEHHRNAGLVDVIGVVSEPAVSEGGNFMSAVSRVKISGCVASGARKTVSLIVKESLQAENSKNVAEGFGVFQTETKMFTMVLCHMEALMDEFADTRDHLWPKLYGAIPFTTLAIEDLKSSGYQTVDRTRWQGLDHALLVLRSLGRFHAMTKVLIKHGLIGESEKGRYWDNMDFMRNFIEGALTTLSRCMANQIGSWSSGWEELASRIRTLAPKIVDKLVYLHGNYDKKFETLCHGDMWSTNMMFREMEYTGVPSSVKFIDFQMCFLGSFHWDVIHYLHTSVKPSVRRAHKSDLLRAYHQSLVDNLKFFNFGGQFPTMDDVISEDRRLLPVAVSCLLAVMPITISNIEKAFDMEKVSNGVPEDTFNQDAFSNEKFVKEVADDITEFARLNVI